MKVLNRSQLVAITLTIALFGIFLFSQLLQPSVLYTFNSWTQRFFTDFGESQSLFSQSVPIHSGTFVLPYQSLLRTTTYLVSNGGGFDSFIIFQFGSVVLRIVYMILVMMIVITLTHKVQLALVTGLLIFTSPFFVFRSHVFVPINVTVLFFLLMIWGFEKYNKIGRIVFLLPVILGLLGNTLYDPTSIIVSAIIILSYTVSFLINEKLRHLEFTYFSVLVCVVLLLPMFGTLIQVVQSGWNTFGDNSLWSLYSNNNDAPLLPLINTYFEMVGYPVMIFSTLGIVAIIWRDFRRYIHLVVMLGLMMLLMVNLSPQISLSPGRMQDYIYIPLLLISAIYISVMFSRSGRLVRMLLISILIAMGIATMINTPPWNRLPDKTQVVVDKLNQLLDEDPHATLYVESDVMFTAILIRHPEQICAYWDPVFQWYRPPTSGDVPDCTQADYRVRRDGRSLDQYQIIEQEGIYTVYKRLPE